MQQEQVFFWEVRRGVGCDCDDVVGVDIFCPRHQMLHFESAKRKHALFFPIACRDVFFFFSLSHTLSLKLVG